MILSDLKSISAAGQILEPEIAALSYYGKDAPPPTPEPLSPEAEQALWINYDRKHNARDRERLVRQYLCWAFSMASRYKGPRLDFDDAVSAANEGLMEAIDGYDPTLGYRFTTYAAWVVRRKLIEAILATYPITITDHIRKKWKANSTPEQLAREQIGDEPRTLEEFFDRLGEYVETDLALLHSRPEDSAFMPCEAENPASCSEKKDLSKIVRQELAHLPPLERQAILRRHYYDPPMSFEQIGAELGVSKNRVREACDAAIVKLRRVFKQDK